MDAKNHPQRNLECAYFKGDTFKDILASNA